MGSWLRQPPSPAGADSADPSFGVEEDSAAASFDVDDDSVDASVGTDVVVPPHARPNGLRSARIAMRAFEIISTLRARHVPSLNSV